jgi:uncharacterized protein
MKEIKKISASKEQAPRRLLDESIRSLLQQGDTDLVPVELEEGPGEKYWNRFMVISLVVFALILIVAFVFSYFSLQEINDSVTFLYNSVDANFLIMLLAGFMAQLVDGALGMGYGLTSATILLSSGASLPAISGSIHTAEVFASGASGYSHYKFGNVNKKLFKALVIPGVLGAIAGAVLLSTYGELKWMRPLLACYTLFLGIKMITNVFRKNLKKGFKRHGILAGAGGFLDSVGGGGWGPIVTTTLISRGRNPKYVIGSVSLTEFFVTLASAFSFFLMMGVSHWQVIIALIIGSTIAAPIAAKLAGRLPRKTSFILLGTLVIIWSGKILLQLL